MLKKTDKKHIRIFLKIESWEADSWVTSMRKMSKKRQMRLFNII